MWEKINLLCRITNIQTLIPGGLIVGDNELERRKRGKEIIILM